MLIKTNKLTGWALAWAVATAEGERVFRPRVARPVFWHPSNPGAEDQWIVRHQVPNVGWFADGPYNPHENWLLGGPIIERERLQLSPQMGGKHVGQWGCNSWKEDHSGALRPNTQYGPTALIAAMRCYVSGKLGDQVEIPKELL